MTQQPNPQQPEDYHIRNTEPSMPAPYPQPPPPGYYIPIKTGPSAGKVILWICLVLFVFIPIVLFIGFVVFLQMT